MTTDELIDYYKGLLILQYASRPNAVAEVDAFIRALVQNQIISQVGDGFDVTTALGAQLNILGTYRGINRVLFGISPGDYWSMVPCADPAPNSYFGWALAAGADPTWRWLEVNDLDSVPYTLSDSQMRRLIQFAAAVDSWDGTLGNLDNILYTFFGVYVSLIDNENMSITYQHTASDPDPDSLFEIAKLADVLPHPAGIAFSVTEV